MASDVTEEIKAENNGVEPPDAADCVGQASSLVQSGKTKEAARLLEQACASEPNSPDLHHSTALLCIQLKDFLSAESHFQSALTLAPDRADILHNLALLYTSTERLEEAKSTILRLLALDEGNADTWNDLAVVELAFGSRDGARQAFETGFLTPSPTRKLLLNYAEFAASEGLAETLEHIVNTYTRRWGSDEQIARYSGAASGETVIAPIEERATDSRLEGYKIAFFASSTAFLTPIIDHLRPANETPLFTTGNEREMRKLLDWCDLAWFEWCDNLLINATKLPKSCLIVCRLHSYEAFTEMPRQVDWSKVDHLLLVNESVREILQLNTKVSAPISVIHNGVDLTRFTIPNHKPIGKRICSIGYINYKKNPALLLYCFKAIHDYDPTYSFHIAGVHQDPRFQVYFHHLLPKLNIPVTFDGWVNDVPAYLQDKDFVISTSLFESFHYSIAEGMASGVVPLIHDWMGAAELYPERFLFTTPEDCVRLLREIEREDRRSLRRFCRRYAEDKLNANDQIEQIETLLMEILQR